MPTDVFVSYRRKDSERVLPLVQALREAGVPVWLDQNEIDEFRPITDGIRKGLAECKALLAWYSADYPKSRPCQMELTAAFLAAQREGDPRRRLLVVNPEGTAAHIEPMELRDTRYAGAPVDDAGYAALAERVKAHLAPLTAPLGAILPIAPPSQYGLKLVAASRFVGRLPDLWRIHSALFGSESAIISGATSSELAQVSGLGGIGKSLLAEEYALRFGAAYPGGIFWLRAFGNDPSRSTANVEARDAVRIEQFSAIAIALGIDVSGLDGAQVEASLGQKLSKEAKRFLWIVDDVGTGWSEGVRAWLAPSPFGKTLVTTRSREYGAIGVALPLGLLAPNEAFELLCARRIPWERDEERAAHGIAADLGYHSLAVDVAGAALEAQAALLSFAQFRTQLANTADDELEFAAQLADLLPSGHEKSVAATLLRSVRSLPPEGQDFLRLASLLAAAPIPPTLVAATLGRLDRLEDSVALRRTAAAFHAVEKASLAERAQADARVVHTLVSRTVRLHDATTDRSAALRHAAVESLVQALTEVSDTRSHGRLAAEVQHARTLSAGALPDADTAILAAWVARHDYERGFYASARELEEKVLAATRRLLGEDDPATLKSMSNLAWTLLCQGDHAGARDLHEQALAGYRRLFGEDDPETLTSMSSLAETLCWQGNYAAARKLEEHVLSARRRLLGAEHADTLKSMNTVGVTLHSQNDLAGARDLHEQALAGYRRLFGKEHAGTRRSMGYLAATLGAQGDLAGARDLREQLLAANRGLLGEEHPETLESMNALAGTLEAQGDRSGARALCEQALPRQRLLLGDEHPNTTATAWNLTRILFATKQREAALEVMNTCLAWLLSANEKTLSAEQRMVRPYVKAFLEKRPET